MRKSRKIIPGLRWGKILKRFRKEAHLNQTKIADAVGYHGNGKGNVSLVEQGKLPINEEKLRLWVTKCNRSMFEFYVLITEAESKPSLLEEFNLSNKSK